MQGCISLGNVGVCSDQSEFVILVKAWAPLGLVALVRWGWRGLAKRLGEKHHPLFTCPLTAGSFGQGHLLFICTKQRVQIDC